MRPAPFEQTYEHQNESGVRLVSTRLSDDAYSTQGKTEVIGANGQVLYQFDENMGHNFIGRQVVYISPDGRTVVVDGTKHFGTSFLRPARLDSDQVVCSVYVDGMLRKEVHYATDLNDGVDIAKVDGGTEFGGGWYPRSDYISDVSINWERSEMTFTTVNGVKIVDILRIG